MKRKKAGRRGVGAGGESRAGGGGASRAKARPTVAARQGATGRAAQHPGVDFHSISLARELFWQNFIREMLTALAVQRTRMLVATPEGEGPAGFDGRMAIVTAQGERVPIADVTPLFACSIGGNSFERALSEDVQCTVFQVRTPSGEVYTFPVHEIRGFHALSEETMRQIEEAAREEGGEEEGGGPFGFAAFTSLARELSGPEASLVEPEIHKRQLDADE